MIFVPKLISIRFLYSLRKLYWNFHGLNWDEFLIDSDYATEIDQIVAKVNSNENTENTSLLDIGCATGNYSIAFAKKHYTVTGLDYAEKMICKARQKAKTFHLQNLKFEIADFNYGLNFKPSQFDIVLASHIFKAVEDTRFLIKEIDRILKEGGLFIVIIKKNGERKFLDRVARKGIRYFLLKLMKVFVFNVCGENPITYKVLQTQIESSNFVVYRKYETVKNHVIFYKKEISY